MKPDIINKISLDGNEVTFKLYLINSFDNLTNITQAYAITLNEQDEILLVSANDLNWQLPGGGVEYGESSIDTLIRELLEEAAIIPNTNSIKPFFYQDVFRIENDQEIYEGTQVRYICRPEVLNEFVEDPDEAHIKYHRWTKLEDLDKYLKWGPTAAFIQKHLPDYL